MNISFNWLNDLIDTGLSVDETARALTRVGLAVEGIHPHNDDFVLDIDLTSNRPDCLSHLGVARELKAVTGQQLTALALGKGKTETPLPAVLAGEIARIEAPDLCRRFTARIVTGVTVGASPRWLVERLESIGERSINNIADITNYVMHELGQPMHAFDLDRLQGNRIVVRRAHPGESITTLDEIERALSEDMLMICDAQKPVAVAGIMGGLDSSITSETKRVLLEVAYFDRASVRATSRSLNLATEASYRFERGVDIGNLMCASNRASDLISELAGGEKGDLIDVFPTAAARNKVYSADIAAAVGRLTALSVSTERCDEILDGLGIASSSETSDGTFYISPSWRHDLAIEEDLVEEIARRVGYEHIASRLPATVRAGELQPDEMRKRGMRGLLTALGFDEAISYSFIDERYDDVFAAPAGLVSDRAENRFVTLADSVIEGATRMRPSLLPGLLDAVRFNLNHQQKDLKLFEIGRVFAASLDEFSLPNEQESLALVISGGERLEDRALVARDLDFYDLKGDLEAAIETLGVSAVEMEPIDVKHLRRGQSARVIAGQEIVGTIGRLSDDVAVLYKFKQPLFVAEINLHSVLKTCQKAHIYVPIARFPAVVRDVTFLVNRSITFAAVKRSIVGQGYGLCQSVEFADIYEGKSMVEDERSMTVRITYQSAERTLIEDEVEAIHQALLSGVKVDLKISPRH